PNQADISVVAQARMLLFGCPSCPLSIGLRRDVVPARVGNHGADREFLVGSLREPQARARAELVQHRQHLIVQPYKSGLHNKAPETQPCGSSDIGELALSL